MTNGVKMHFILMLQLRAPNWISCFRPRKLDGPYAREPFLKTLLLLEPSHFRLSLHFKG